MIDHARIKTFKSSYDALLYALELLGVTTLDQAVQAMPDMLPRTLKRAFQRSVQMGMSFDPKETTHTHVDTTDLASVTLKAQAVKVSPKMAMLSLLRYGNSVERVSGVLDDIQALIRAGCRIWNPTGFFVRTMRSGRDVILPDAVVVAREDQQEQRPEPVRIQVGSWALVDGDWLRVEAVDGGNVHLFAPEGFRYRYTVAGYDAWIPLERIRTARRAAERPAD